MPRPKAGFGRAPPVPAISAICSNGLQRLHDFAHTSGCPQLHTQLAFADKELRNETKFSCFWEATTERAAYAALRRGFGRGSC